MNRRQAAKTMILTGASAVLLPYCNLETFPVFEKLMLEKKANQAVQALINLILPEDPEQMPTPESRFFFVLNQVNEMFSPKDIESFKKGLSDLTLAAKEETGKDFHKLELEEQEAFLLAKAEATEEVQFLMDRVKGLCIRHYTSSEYFMTEIMDYVFIPGRYDGCASL